MGLPKTAIRFYEDWPYSNINAITSCFYDETRITIKRVELQVILLVLQLLASAMQIKVNALWFLLGKTLIQKSTNTHE
jgi:hypothetical protein